MIQLFTEHEDLAVIKLLQTNIPKTNKTKSTQ